MNVSPSKRSIFSFRFRGEASAAALVLPPAGDVRAVRRPRPLPLLGRRRRRDGQQGRRRAPPQGGPPHRRVSALRF